MTRHSNSAFFSLFSSLGYGIVSFSPALLAVFAFCVAGSSQTLQTAPVARLLSVSSREVLPARGPATVRERLSRPAASAYSVSPSINDATVIERRAFERTNDERIKAGVAPLVWDADLCRMARLHSESMARLGFFAHETPEGLQLKERAKSLGIPHFRVIAENIAYNKGYEDPGAFAVERWMISAGHRSNILYVGFQNSAIGSHVSADGSVYLTQVFINR